MQSFCAVAFGSKLAIAALPASVTGQLLTAAPKALNSLKGGNHVPAMLVAAAVFAAYTLREAMKSG